MGGLFALTSQYPYGQIGGRVLGGRFALKNPPIWKEYHTICCGLCGILSTMEMVKGRDIPSELPQDPKTKKTSNLLIRRCSNVKSAGKVVILDSGFYVLEGIIAIKTVEVYVGALIKKQRYWPKYVPGQRIEEHFQTKDVDDTDSLHGKMNGIPYDIVCMKEPNYIMNIVSTYGGLIVKDEKRESKR